MSTQTPRWPSGRLRRATRRHALVFPLLRALGITIAAFVLYFTLPLDHGSALKTGLALMIGLVALAGLLAWHARAIARAPYPQVRAIVALITSFPVFVLLFSTTYFVMDQYSEGSYSQAMTRLDALYFAVTVFSTVGFGDITAVSQPARIITMVQMVLGLVLLGLVVKAFYQSVQAGLTRRDSGGGDQ